MAPSDPPSSPHPERRLELQPALPFADARERLIEELSLQFASDNLSIEELELRMERAYKATTVAELQSLTADLPQLGTAAVPARVPQPIEQAMLAPERERVLSLMSETRRRGVWAVPQRLDLYAMMSDTTIDLTQATLPAGIVDIHLRAICASVKIIVPPGLQVVSRLSSVMSSVGGGSEPASERAGVPAWHGTTVVRLSGYALMAEVQTRVRRRERGYAEDDDSTDVSEG
jgi:hypothetical protein